MVDIINSDWIDLPQHRPKFIKIKNSNLHGKGAFALKNIKKGTFLGHYMGEIHSDYKMGPYIFHSYTEKSDGDEELFSIDASDPKKSNWTRYMNCSTNPNNENVMSSRLSNKEIYEIQGEPVSIEGYIAFYAGRDIKKGEELLYHYGNDYMKLLGLELYEQKY
jgi:SET domain-containing protein